MIRSMLSAVSGLKSHQTMLDVIGNNVANVNTVGFKSSRVLFSDLYYQTIANANAPTETAGGSNPKQIGYGAQVRSIDVINTRGHYQQTSRTLDLYISGEGYFAVQTPDGIRFTRVGSFDFDKDGNLVDANQNFVLDNEMNRIQIENFNDYTGIYIESNGEIIGINLRTKAVETIGQVGLAIIPNPNGLLQEGDMYYAETTNSGTSVKITYLNPGEEAAGSIPEGDDLTNVSIIGDGYFAVRTPEDKIMYTKVGGFSVDNNGYLVDSNNNLVLDKEKEPIQIPDGYTFSRLEENGVIIATKEPDGSTEEPEEISVGQIGIAVILNLDVLKQDGDYYFEGSNTIQFVKPSEGMAGLLVSGGLEMSNVDLTKEFTDMIVAQRVFQANSRVITTSDHVLEEIVNLKR